MLTKYEKELALTAIKRKTRYLILSLVSVSLGLGLAIYYSWEAYAYPDFDVGIHFVLVVMILLNGRKNLRQHNYEKILEKIGSGEPGAVAGFKSN